MATEKLDSSVSTVLLERLSFSVRAALLCLSERDMTSGMDLFFFYSLTHFIYTLCSVPISTMEFNDVGHTGMVTIPERLPNKYSNKDGNVNEYRATFFNRWSPKPSISLYLFNTSYITLLNLTFYLSIGCPRLIPFCATRWLSPQTLCEKKTAAGF